MKRLPKELTTVTPLSKILAGVFFVTFPFISFFLGMQYQYMTDLYNQQLAEESISNPPRKLTPTPAETANWKTYTNTKYGFEIKYPEYLLEQVSSSETIIISSASNCEDDQPCSPPPSISVRILDNPKNLSTKEFAKPDLELHSPYVKEYSSNELQSFFNFNLPISKVFGARYSGLQCGENSNFYIKNKDKIIDISFACDEDFDNFDQILQTFKFTDQNPTPTTVIEGKVCGGKAGNLPENKCPSGYYCKPDFEGFDVPGKCVKN